jgi:hypothetical protein
MWDCLFGNPTLRTLAQNDQCLTRVHALQAWLDIFILGCLVLGLLGVIGMGLCLWRVRVLRARQP